MVFLVVWHVFHGLFIVWISFFGGFPWFGKVFHVFCYGFGGFPWFEKIFHVFDGFQRVFIVFDGFSMFLMISKGILRFSIFLKSFSDETNLPCKPATSKNIRFIIYCVLIDRKKDRVVCFVREERLSAQLLSGTGCSAEELLNCRSSVLIVSSAGRKEMSAHRV